MTIPWIPCHYVRRQVKSKKGAIETIIREQKDLVANLDETTASIKELKHDIEMITKDNELSFQEIRRNVKNPGNLADDNIAVGTRADGVPTANIESDEYAKLEEEEEIIVQRIDSLEKSIQKSAEKRISERHVFIFARSFYFFFSSVPLQL